MKNELEMIALMEPATWSRLEEAITIVHTGFGGFFLDNALAKRGEHHLVHIYVGECDVIQRERGIKADLDAIGWQMITIFLLDQNRFKRMGSRPATEFPSNVYGLAPLEYIKLTLRPSLVYHATEITNIEAIKKEGLKPGNRKDYPDAEGKLHVCHAFDGDEGSAAYWARLLSENRGLSLSDYTILEINLEGVPARTYHDLHGLSGSGIVIDQFSVIPPNTISNEFRFSDGKWMKFSS